VITSLFLIGCGASASAPADDGEPPRNERSCPRGDNCEEEDEPAFPAAKGPTSPEMRLSGQFTQLPLPIAPGDFRVGRGTSTNVPDLSSGIFADLDGDSFPEILIGNSQCCQSKKSFRVFRFDPLTQELLPADDLLAKGPGVEPGAISAAADLDGDSQTDFITLDFRQVFVQGNPDPVHHSPILYADEGGILTSGGPIPSPTDDERAIQSHAMDLVDLDADGWLDILFSEMNCSDSDGATIHALIRVGERAYARREEWFEQGPQSKAEVVFARPLLGEAMLAFSGGHNCSNGNPSPAFFKAGPLEANGSPSFQGFDPTPLLSVYKSTPEVSFGPISLAEPMGCALMDFNHDGRLDLAISMTHHHAMFEGTDEGEFIDRTAELQHSAPVAFSGPRRMIPWGMAPVDLDLDGFMDLVIAHGDREGKNLLEGDVNNDSWAMQHVTSFRNRGRFVFDNISDQTGLDATGNWHSITVGDLNRDGRADLIIGSAGSFPRVHLNELTTPHHGFAVELRGTTSNPLGIGALIAVETAATPPQLGVMGNAISPRVVSQPLVFFGTGAADTVGTLRVTWPSGHVQTLQDLPAEGVHVIEEPPLITLDPPSRHLPAGSAAEMRIQVRPHDTFGAPLDAVVTIEAPWGEATFAGPIEESGEHVWERRLVAPEEAGSSVIEVTINGVPLGIRPRIWWD